MFKYATPLLLFVACSDAPPTTPETAPVDNPNADNTAIYDVDPEDPYEIGDSSFLDMRPGMDVGPFTRYLRPGIIPVNGQDETIYYIEGRNRERLGYVKLDTLDKAKISGIYISSPDVVTRQGIRVGNNYQEILERLGELQVEGGSGNPVYLTQGQLSYRLAMNELQDAFDPAAIDSTTKILEIVIK